MSRLFSCALVFAATAVAAEWAEVVDPADLGDSSGDIRSVGVQVKGDYLYLSMTVEGVAAPSVEQTPQDKSNRYYYHWLLDTDNNPATGRSNAEYEGKPTGVKKPVGSERVIMIGWRDGKPNGIEAYDPLDEDTAIKKDFAYQASGNTLTAMLSLAELGLSPGQTVAVSAFQEGASDGWAVDWVESQVVTLSGLTLSRAVVSDSSDLGDTSGDIREVTAHVEGANLVLAMTVQGVAAPSVEQTPQDKSNRYYYHWLLDTDNNPATGRSNAEYEGKPTGVNKSIGTERVVMIGWRDGKPNGVEVYDPLNEDTAIKTGFAFQASGNTLTAVIPLADLGLSLGQTIGVSAFQEGASDGWAVDWLESQALTLSGPTGAQAVVPDPADLGDTAGDIREISAQIEGPNLVLSMTVEGIAAPSATQTLEGKSNRYYYHWLIDTDNNPATGRSNAEYEGKPTGVKKSVGTERVVMIGWRDGKPNGVEVYDPLNEDVAIKSNFRFQASGNTLSAALPLADLGLTVGQTVALSAFQEGASDGWAVDWIESQAISLEPLTSGRMRIDGSFQDWASAASAGAVTTVEDPQDLGDSSGDIKAIQATVENGYLYLRMSVHGTILPSVEQTPEGKVNRYYYHWLLDTDNNPATGRSNAEYEGNPTGVKKPIGAERVIMIGWRDGKPNGLEVYDPLNEDVALVTNLVFKAEGDSVETQLRLSDLKLSAGQTIAISAFQEGASDGWAVDWIESAVMTLSEAGGGGLTVETQFAADAYRMEFVIEDSGTSQVDAGSVILRLDGQVVQAKVGKTGGVTTVESVHASLLAVDSLHTATLSLKVGGALQSKDFVFKVEPYTVLPLQGSLGLVNTSNLGFVARATQISIAQSGLTSLHTNIAELAERQLAGELKDEATGLGFINEADENTSKWTVTPEVVTGTVNWFELAPSQDASLNFPNDQPFPKLPASAGPLEGVVMELLTYLELSKGHHKLGLYTEGGHKITAGLTKSDPVLSLFDNSGDVVKVPSYFARNQFFNVVATEAGYYPIRLLWFQSRRSQELGLMLELFSVKGRELVLLNDASKSNSIKAFRAGSLIPGSGASPSVNIRLQTGGVTVQWTGVLQVADQVNGPYRDYADDSRSPATLPTTEGMKFLRARR